MFSKKTWLVSLSLVLVLSLLLGACSAPADGEAAKGSEGKGGEKGEQAAKEVEGDLKPEEGAELLVWDSGDAEGKWTKYVAKKFEEKYGVPVKYEEVAQPDAPKKMETDGPSGLGADVFNAPHDHAGAMVNAGLILDNFFPETYEKEFSDAAITGTSVDGELYGYPTAVETYALYYNKDLVKQAPETMDELIAQAKRVNGDGKYGFMMEVGNFYYAYSFIGGYGGYVFKDNDTKDIGLNNEGAVKGAKLLQRIHNEVLPLKNEDITYDVKQALFNEGKLAFNVDGPWAVAGHREAKVNFGVAPLPKLDNGEHPQSFSGIKALYVNANTTYPDAASLYAQFATSDEMLKKRYEMTGQLPARTSVAESDEIKNDEVLSAFVEQTKHALPMPNIPQMGATWDPMGAALTAIWNDNADPQKALDKAVKQIEEAMSIQK